MINSKNDLGKLTCTVEQGSLIVGMPNTLRLRYTAGRYGIDDGGYIWFIRSGVTDWQAIDLINETKLGYTSIHSNANVRFEVDTPDGMRPFETGIRVTVRDGCLKKDDYVELIMGDTSKGSPGILVQTIAQERHMIFAAVDPWGTNRYEEVTPACYLKVNSGGIADYNIILPSSVKVGEDFTCNIRVIDDYGNRCESFVGRVELNAMDEFICPEFVDLSEKDRGCKSFSAKVLKEGVYRLSSSIPKYNLFERSNPCRTIGKGEKQLLWGDMHGQNIEGSGIGSMDEVLSFSKNVGVLDFTGWQGNDFEVSDSNWQNVKDAVKQYHKDNEFVVFLGYEWSGITANGGDHNIYFLGDDEEILRSGKWLWKNKDKILPSGNYEVKDYNPITELWDAFKGRKDVMAIPHVGGRYGNFDYYNPEFTSVIEIYSHHGIFEWFLEDAVKRKMKVGFIAASDDHTSRVGLSYPMGSDGSDIGATFDVKSGLTALYVEEFTREGIWKALRERSCYAATSSRMILEYKCNGFEMGQEINLAEKPNLTAKIHGTAAIDRIELYRDEELIYQLNPIEKENQGQKEVIRVKVAWSGVRTRFRRKSISWNGRLFVKKGMIIKAENYSIDNPFDGIQGMNRHIVKFVSKTSGDEDGIIIDIIPEQEDACEIILATEQGNVTCNLKDLIGRTGDITYDLGEINKKIEFSLVNTEDSCMDAELIFLDENVKEGLNIYYLKAYQRDGNRLWSSPIFVNYFSDKV